MDQKLWVRMPVSLIGKISFGALAALSLLLNRDQNGSHTVYLRRKEFAESLQCSVRTVDGILSELEQAKLITKTRVQTAMRIDLAPDILPPRRNYAKMQTQPSCSSLDMDMVHRLVAAQTCTAESPSRK